MIEETAHQRLQVESTSKFTGAKMDPDVKAAILQDLRDGNGVVSVAEKHSVSAHTVTALRNAAEDEEPAFNLVAWKKSTAATLSHFVSKGAKKLERQVEEMPLTALPIAIAVAIDKLLLLHDQPQTIVEQRLRIDHHAVNDMLKADGIVLDAEIVENVEIAGE